jgi:hypothetical protein
MAADMGRGGNGSAGNGVLGCIGPLALAGTSQIFFTQYCTIIAAQIKAECYIYLRWVSCDLLYDLLNHKPSLEWFIEVFLNIKVDKTA